MLFYYNTTDGGTHYFSVYHSLKALPFGGRPETRIVEIEMDDLWELVKEGTLQLTEISPADFPHKIPANILGDVKAFII